MARRELRVKKMPRENVEVVRELFAAFAEGADERLRELVEPDVDFDVSRTSPERRVGHGYEEAIAITEEWGETWADHEVELLGPVDAGAGKVVAVMRERGKMKGSDGWVEHDVGIVCTLREGRITRYEEHRDRSAALRAAALP